MTSAPNLSQVSLRSSIVFGRPPRFFESQRIILSGSMCLWIRFVIVDPKVFSWSEPIQMRNLNTCQRGSKQKIFVTVDAPVWALDAGRQGRPYTSSGAYTDSSLKHLRSMSDTSYIMLVNKNDMGRKGGSPNFNSLVHIVLGGLLTMSLVKSP